MAYKVDDAVKRNIKEKFKDAVILQKIFNHSSQRITLMYIGIEQDEIDLSYKNFE